MEVPELPMVFIRLLTEKWVGREFEIECHDIEVHGIPDNCPPLYKGPGVISGKEKGAFSFRLHNQIPLSEKDFNLFIGKNLQNEDIQARIFAIDYEGIHWTGGWSIPNVYSSKSGKFIVHGQFEQLSTIVKRYEGNICSNTTELVFANIPEVPLTELVEEERKHRGEKVYSRTWANRHELNFNGVKINFLISNNDNLFHITADHKEGFLAPYVENWIPEALTFITATLTYPRMIIRHFEDESRIFLRNTPSNIKSKMPSPILGTPNDRKEIWNIFKAYLEECVRCNEFEQLATTKIFSEVIIASTGTLQAFVLSLAVCVENLIGQLDEDEQLNDVDRSDVPDKDTWKNLKNYIEKWEGNTNVRDRAIKLLYSQIFSIPIKKKMEILQQENVVEEKHIKAWKGIRNSLAHGKIIEFPVDKDFWLKRNILISMVYRLVLRKIGYKGLITDHASPDIESIDFQWERTYSAD
ncbi:hypothetical protein [Coleofasciculus chthonoplastes]|uniref:hypothetical protein n=1 Tax=Coleofasciculus chthonoplastes TaxID=64178 RepID=UPI0032F4A902